MIYDYVIAKPLLNEETLAHYGVKGMKWHKRKKRTKEDIKKIKEKVQAQHIADEVVDGKRKMFNNLNNLLNTSPEVRVFKENHNKTYTFDQKPSNNKYLYSSHRDYKTLDSALRNARARDEKEKQNKEKLKESVFNKKRAKLIKEEAKGKISRK